jgi:hypothetical protein
MPTKFAKGDEVRVDAKKFDGEGELDEVGLKFSERWLRDGNGVWCYGKISFIFKKQSRQPQKYRIKYHEGTVMESLEADIEMAPEEEDEDDTSLIEREEREDRGALNIDDRVEDDEDQRHPLDREEDAQSEGDDGNVELESESDNDEEEDDDTVTVGGVLYNINAKSKRRRVTVDEAAGTEIKVGETVTAGTFRWERVQDITEDQREEPHFDTTFKCKCFAARRQK